MKNFCLTFWGAMLFVLSIEFSHAQIVYPPTIPDPPVPLIIVDKIIAVHDCELGEANERGPGSKEVFCIQKSTNLTPYFNNAYGAQINKGESFTTFTLVYAPFPAGALQVILTNVKQSNGGHFKFLKINDTQIECKFDDVLLMRITNIVNSTNQAKIQLDFFDDCAYASCGSVTCSPSYPSEPHYTLRGKEAAAPISSVAPNPFASSAFINYQLHESSPVNIALYNAQGALQQTLWHEPSQDAGSYQILLDAANLNKGTYFAVLQIGNKTQTHTLIKTD